MDSTELQRLGAEQESLLPAVDDDFVGHALRIAKRAVELNAGTSLNAIGRALIVVAARLDRARAETACERCAAIGKQCAATSTVADFFGVRRPVCDACHDANVRALVLAETGAFRRAFLGCPCGVSSREWLAGEPCPRCGHRHTEDERAAIDIIRRAVVAEREHCAKVAETFSGFAPGMTFCDVADRIAVAIRAFK